MQHECKITVLETKVFSDLQEKYLANPKSGPCPCFKAGDTFLLKRTSERDDFYHLMNGKFCGEAWDAISRYVYTALQGGSIMHKWTNDERMMIACCMTVHDLLSSKLRELIFLKMKKKNNGWKNKISKTQQTMLIQVNPKLLFLKPENRRLTRR